MSRTLCDVHGPTTGAVVVCAGVSRTFRRGGHEVPAVRDVSCTIRPGMRIALTGPSGSGKSTLLHLLAGLDRPTAGTITRPGLPPAEPWSFRVGVAFQGPSLIPTLDALENVTLPLLIEGVDENAAVVRAAALLDRLEIRGLAGHLPDELSGGQAQRVGIARALVRAPLLILADEPTGQLDRATADHVMAVLVDAARESGSALIVSTHDPLVSGPLPVHWSMADGRLTTDGPR